MRTRIIIRFGIGVVVAAVVATMGPFAQAATLPPSPVSVPFHYGPHIMPMVGGKPMRSATTPGPSSVNMQYYGGKVISSVRVVDVLWGPGDASHTYLPEVGGSATAKIDNFYQNILGSSKVFTSWLNTDYNTIYTGSGTHQAIGSGSFVGRDVITPSITSTTVTDAQIQAELAAQIQAGHLPAPTLDASGNPQTYYSVFFPSGMTITLGSYTSCQAGGFLAYHGTVSGNGSTPEFYYAVEPDQSQASPCYNNIGTGTPFGDTTVAASHELAEAITDPEVGLANSISSPLGWYDPNTGEIGDGCADTAPYYPNGNIVGSDGAAYDVQYLWSKTLYSCYLPGDFRLTPSRSTITVTPGSGTQIAIDVPTTSGSASDNVQLSVVGAPAGVTATLDTPTLNTPGNSALNVLAAASTAPGTYNLIVTGASLGLTHSITVPLVVSGPVAPTITSPATTQSAVNQLATFKVTTTGFPTSQLSEIGPLPPGMAFTDNRDGTASIAGIPTAVGTYQFTVTATDGTAPDASQVLTYVVGQAPAITSASQTSSMVHQPGSFTVTTSGYPASGLSEVGSLPPGMTFTDNHDGTATIVGTPTAYGAYPITITASDGTSPDATQSFTYTVTQQTTFTSASSAASKVGQAASVNVTTTGYPAAALAESGALPPGMSFTDNGNGTATIAGTPTATGTYPLTITAANSALGMQTQSFTYVVDQAPVFTSAASTAARVNQAASFSVTTTGYPASTVTETGALPPGMSFTDKGDGTATIAGIPTATGTYVFTMSAANPFLGSVTQSFTYTVDQATAFTSAATTASLVNQVESYTVTTTGYPAAALSESGVLPPGITFTDHGDGTATLGGTPTATGTYRLTITAANALLGTTTQAFTYTVQQPPAITSASSASAMVGTATSFTVTSNGYPAATLTDSGSLPTGMTFVDNKNGTATMSGTPTNAGTYFFTITASNGVGANATQTFTYTVRRRTKTGHHGAVSMV